MGRTSGELLVYVGAFTGALKPSNRGSGMLPDRPPLGECPLRIPKYANCAKFAFAWPQPCKVGIAEMQAFPATEANSAEAAVKMSGAKME
jgi:hypothetical protein